MGSVCHALLAEAPERNKPLESGGRRIAAWAGVRPGRSGSHRHRGSASPPSPQPKGRPATANSDPYRYLTSASGFRPRQTRTDECGGAVSELFGSMQNVIMHLQTKGDVSAVGGLHLRRRRRNRPHRIPLRRRHEPHLSGPRSLHRPNHERPRRVTSHRAPDNAGTTAANRNRHAKANRSPCCSFHDSNSQRQQFRQPRPQRHRDAGPHGNVLRRAWK
jgi:hypothetical protein